MVFGLICMEINHTGAREHPGAAFRQTKYSGSFRVNFVQSTKVVYNSVIIIPDHQEPTGHPKTVGHSRREVTGLKIFKSQFLLSVDSLGDIEVHMNHKLFLLSKSFI